MSPPLSNAKRAWAAPISPRSFVVLMGSAQRPERVIPAKAGIQFYHADSWMPAVTGMTIMFACHSKTSLDFVRHGRLRRSLTIELRHQPDGNRADQHGYGGGVKKFRRRPAGGEQKPGHEWTQHAA